MKTLSQITEDGILIAKEYMQAYAQRGVTIVAPAFYPSRLLGTISSFSKNGCNVVMAGGGSGQKFFENVPQYTIDRDTTGLDETTENVKKIVDAIPEGSLTGDIAILLYSSILEGDNLWQKSISEKFSKTRIVASNEQNITSFFEEKTNLSDILTFAGLEKYIIPNQLVKTQLSVTEKYKLYERLKDENGRIVIQSCGPNVNEKGGGYSTIIVNNFDDFCKSTKLDSGYLKVAKFIEGCNSNVSLCIGNMLPNKTLMGAFKGELLPDESRYSVKTLKELYFRGLQNGLNRNNTFFMVQPGTLKVVGDKHLTASPTNGVGNQLNFNFPQNTLEEIYGIGKKLASFMAICGKVGLSGIDLIITKSGRIYINEINDRQQGPTETASLNNEINGLPSLQRTAFILNYGNLTDARTQEYFRDIKENAERTYFAATKIPSQFYVKLMGKQPCVSAVNLQNGVYSLSKSEEGVYNWDLSNPEPEMKGVQVDLAKEQTKVCLSDVSLQENQDIQTGRQILRINGIAMPGSEPFCLEDGVSKLNPTWVPVVESLQQAIIKTQQFSAEDSLANNSSNQVVEEQ